MDNDLVCWKCGAPLDELPLPLARLAECLSCGTELHVCRLCEFFDPQVAKQCREPVAEEVKDKDRANFCGYFQVRPGAYVASDSGAVHQAKEELESLFGSGGTEKGSSTKLVEDNTKQQLDNLFKKS